MRDAKNSDSRSQGEKCVPSNGKDREQKRKKQVSNQMSDVKTESIKSIIAKMRLLSDVSWGPSEESWDGNEKPTKSSGERDKEDEKKCWKSRENERLFMNWKSDDGLCRHAFPNLRERQTRMRKHQQVNYTKNRNVIFEHSFNDCYMWDHVLIHDDTCLTYAWVWLIISCVKSLTWYHHHHCQLWEEISEESISIVFEHVLCIDLDFLLLNI